MNVPFETSATLAAIPRVAHGFFGRRGGVSSGAHAALNISETSGDDFALVARNRALATAQLGFDPAALTTLTQTHSSTVITLTAPPSPGERREGDAMVTNVPGAALGILTADCAPILLADAEAGVIAACHAGWKGAAADIAHDAVLAMVALGADPGRILAAIGPAISLDNYEVGPDFAADLIARHRRAADRILTPAGGKEHFDLPGFIADQLRDAGIGSVESVGSCTYAAPERYFSHRYATHHGTTTGRQIAIIGLR